MEEQHFAFHKSRAHGFGANNREFGAFTHEIGANNREFRAFTRQFSAFTREFRAFTRQFLVNTREFPKKQNMACFNSLIYLFSQYKKAAFRTAIFNDLTFC
ncbi:MULTISPECIES: hypothetical protein [unclassified Bacillus (in: firmicutes)]|uniref:hypothetical protein n=1 Tax=unclassified Bacillus (in: firmicutes) TaxID=185979 RepID=UPI001BEC1561|nr:MULTISPECIES: hypothetical protein [unclassified Bacillus (in: firmicutes)]MBT2617885.1 hypothetical protein [Bacillus sp. ISL-78]MBT2631162.1 hypothetical protein [Bacillus sp. ISL-101]